MRQTIELFNVLKEGQPQSLGRLLEVFQQVIDKKVSVQDIYSLYEVEDPLVSMRVSNIFKRLWRLNPSYVIPHLPLFLKDEQRLKNPTFRWTLAQLFKELYDHLSIEQKPIFIQAIVKNLALGEDWIMLVQSMDALVFAKKKGHTLPNITHALKKLTSDQRKVVKNKAIMLLNIIQIN